MKILEAIYHLFTFKPYTIYDRWFEISCGILAWLSLGLIIFPWIK